jgi:hypothetical protein
MAQRLERKAEGLRTTPDPATDQAAELGAHPPNLREHTTRNVLSLAVPSLCHLCHLCQMAQNGSSSQLRVFSTVEPVAGC